MKRPIYLTIFVLAISFVEITMPGYSQSTDSQRTDSIDAYIVFDNYSADATLDSSWGFGCVIRTPSDIILFDTGSNGSILLSNMERMNINPKSIDIVVLSHNHYDHVGGLEDFLHINSDIKVFMPATFPNSLKEMVTSQGAELHEISTSEQISDIAYTTGVIGRQIKEQSLVLDTKCGIVVITGCAHPGIVDIIRKAKEILPNKEIYLVTGGFHLLEKSDAELRDIVSDFRYLGVKKVAPSHCSGDRCRKIFQEEYHDDYINQGIGQTFTF